MSSTSEGNMYKKMRLFSLLLGLISVLLLSACTNSVEFTINFDSNGGSEVSSIKTDGTSSITLPNDPIKDGYSFAGWYWDNSTFRDLFTVNSLLERGISGNLTVYAKWIINQYTITFNSNGGSSVSSITQDYDTLVIAPANPTKLGYTFSGWSQPVPIKMPAEDITLYAKWNIITYINYYIHPDDYDPLKDISLAPGETIIQVSLGGGHSAALTSEGRLFTWGDNSAGELGDGTTRDKYTPTEITSRFSLATGDKIISVSLGYNYSAALTSSGRLFTWGYNWDGQLGDGTTTGDRTSNRSTPTEITSRISLATGDKIIQVSLGNSHSAALTSSGRLFTWGYNEFGQLGVGIRTRNRSTPTEITSRISLATGDKIISVSLGYDHSAALTSNGRLFIWGRNDSGQLGDGTETQRYTPTEITNHFSLSTGDKIIQVSLGDVHSAALTSSGRLFTWGNNLYGQLGDGTTISDRTTTERSTPTEITNRFSLATGDKIIQVSLGYNHSAALTSEGRLFTWGNNADGQLGDGTTFFDAIDKYTPTEITNRFSLATEDKIISVSLGSYHSAALTSSGRLFTWGINYSNQLGDGTNTNRSTPTEITQAHYELLHSDTVIYNQSIMEYVPLRDGYIFSGWYSDINLNTPYIFGSMPAEDITLHGKWVSKD